MTDVFAFSKRHIIVIDAWNYSCAQYNVYTVYCTLYTTHQCYLRRYAMCGIAISIYTHTPIFFRFRRTAEHWEWFVLFFLIFHLELIAHNWNGSHFEMKRARRLWGEKLFHIVFDKIIYYIVSLFDLNLFTKHIDCARGFFCSFALRVS